MNANNHFFDQTIILENARVKLVPFSAEYEDGLRKIIFDSAMNFVSAYSKDDEDFNKYMEKTLNECSIHNSYPFIVIDRMTNEVAGSTRYGHIKFDSKRLEIGWTWYGEKFRGTGLNKACKYALLQYAFEVMDFRRVQFSADIDNIRSQKAILKLGATQEGIFRANDINSEGQSRDDVYFSIIYSEWNHIKETIFKEFLLDHPMAES